MRPASSPDDTAYLTGSVEGWRLSHDGIVRIAVQEALLPTYDRGVTCGIGLVHIPAHDGVVEPRRRGREDVLLSWVAWRDAGSAATLYRDTNIRVTVATARILVLCASVSVKERDRGISESHR